MLHRLIDDFLRDVRLAIRGFRRAPLFALLAIGCLGLGIGVNTSIFGVLNAVLLRPLPVAEPDTLVVASRGDEVMFSYPLYRDFEVRRRVLTALTVSSPAESDFDVDGASEFVAAEAVAGNYATVLGLQPALGRWFADDVEPAAVISYPLWQRRFNGDRSALGRQIRSGSQSYTIIGVAPQAFGGIFSPLRTDLWVPVRTRPDMVAQLQNRDANRFMVFGRLSGTATPAQASSELTSIDRQVALEAGTADRGAVAIAAQPVRGIPHPANRRRMVVISTMMAVVVAIVLFTACVNVAHLLLVRGAVRFRELGVRRALGATRGRVVRQLLTESLVLAIGGGICGLLFGFWTNAALEQSFVALGPLFPANLQLSLDWTVVAFAMGASLVTTVLCGVLPAWRCAQSGNVPDLRSDTAPVARAHRKPIGLVAQVALSLILLTIAGAFLRGALSVQTTDPGFAAEGRLYAHAFVPTPPFTPQTGRVFYEQAVERLRQLPGVERVALAYRLPLARGGSDCASLPAGPQVPLTADTVGSGYFDAIGIPLVAGRDFAATAPTSESSVIVNEGLARRFWPGRPAVGERILIGCRNPREAVVAAVARNSTVRAFADRSSPHVYLSFADRYAGGLISVIVAARGDTLAFVEPVRRTLLSLGQGIRVYQVEPMRDHVKRSYAVFEWLALVVAAFGAVALALAATGLYGVISYRTAVRRREIGVRMALGASRRDIFRQVVGQGLAIALVGVLIGAALSAGVTRAVASVQSGLVSAPVSTQLATVSIWIVVAVLACYLPARRAAGIDPLRALREE